MIHALAVLICSVDIYVNLKKCKIDILRRIFSFAWLPSYEGCKIKQNRFILFVYTGKISIKNGRFKKL